MTIKRALIVDDSSTAQYRLKKMLRAYPLDIDIVDSGEAALRYLARHAPAVIFMDHLMPGIDGFRALQIIKSNPDTAMIPVIMYTSKSGDVYTGQARALGALDVVSKDRINAMDLSKVMETIHIYPSAQNNTGDGVESAEFIAAANQVTASNSDTATQVAPTDRRAASLEQARNLELRLSHMEHSLEDNRRFITSRVVRELQGLRQNLRQEFSDILQQQPAIPAPAAPVVEVETKPAGSGWSMLATVVSLAAFAIIAYVLLLISNQLDDSKSQQEQLSKQLQQVAELANKEPDLISPAQINAAGPQPIALNATAAPDPLLLDDLAWTFNQSGFLTFHQNTIDPKPLLRLHELLHRLASNGFKGTATVNVYVGDFCVTVDNMGMAQLAPTNKTLGDCMLSSEIYTLDRLQTDYSREVSMILGNLTRDVNSTIQIAINAAPGPEPYPERIPQINAGDWNSLAQNNNRLELVLVAADE
jgi:CheY-like chemotaxis protein